MSNLGGRHKAITEEEVIQAIGKYQTSSPSELAKALERDGTKVSRKTLYRRLKALDPDLVQGILGQVTQQELKPTEKTFTAFCALPDVVEYNDNMQYVRQTSDKYRTKRLRDLHWICQQVNRNPKYLRSKESVDIIANLVMDLKKGKVERHLEATMTSIRSWYLFVGIAGSYLTSKGITGDRLGRGKRSRIKLTPQERREFLAVVQSKFNGDYEIKQNGSVKAVIEFGSYPLLQDAMIQAIKFLYYTGTRRNATFEANWRDVTWGKPITFVHVIDKGKHKTGRSEWGKRIAGDHLAEFEAYWIKCGKPQQGRIFPFNPNHVTSFFKECFLETQIPKHKFNGMPVHIWRHTACQDLLDSNDRNYEVTAELLGWESTDQMKISYGASDIKALNLSLIKSMGLPVPKEEKKEFRF